MPAAAVAWLASAALVPGVAGAQSSPQACYAASSSAPAPLDARTANAERSVAARDLAAGRPFAAIDRLERILGAGGLGATAAAGDAAAESARTAAMATLAAAYERAGCGTAQAALSARLAGSLRDPAAGVTLGAPLGAAARAAAWTAYRAGDFAAAEAQFAAAAATTPGAADRFDLRLLQAQALLQSRASARAATLAQAVADSARTLAAQADARGAAGAPQVTAFARAAVAQRAVGILWAPAVADGRAVGAAPGATPADLATLAPVAATQVQGALTALGAPAADPAVRALLWTAGEGGLAAVRALSDTLREADARAGRAAHDVAAARDARPARLAAAARYVAAIRQMNDSLAAADAAIRPYAARLAARDTAIAAAIAVYRATIDAKIAATRTLAAQNRARIDSIEPLARAAGAVTTNFFLSEQATAGEFRSIADVAADALESRLTRLEIIAQRDTVRARHRALLASLAAGRAAQDSALAAALAAEREAGAVSDRALAAAQESQRRAEAYRDSVVERAVAATADALAGRLPELKRRLATLSHGAAYAAATSLFFALIEGDTIRAPAADLARRRDAAIAALTEAVTTYAESPLRPEALLQLGEALARKADADFAASQAGAAGLDRPEYGAAIARFDEFLTKYPAHARVDVAAYTLGTLAFGAQRFADAIRAFEIVSTREGSPYRAEAFFRNGDAQFEQAATQSGAARRAAFGTAATSYDRALNLAPRAGDIYFLSLYKLGWSNYMQAERQASDEYRIAVDIFARLVREVDALPAAQQARLALRQEAIDYLAIAITQLGGAEEAVRFLGTIPDVGTRMLVLRRVAHALRDQGEFTSAVIAFRGALEQAPVHPAVLETHLELVELFQSRMIEPRRAQEARLDLVASLAPSSPWGQANAPRAAEAATARERALREAGNVALTEGRKPGAAGAAAGGTAPAAGLFARYLTEFSGADSAQRVSLLEGDARFGARDWFASGSAYARTASRWPNGNAATSAVARRNALVAFDSALATERRATARDAARLTMVEDSLFAAAEAFIAVAAPDDAKAALMAKGRRASEAQRWDLVADAFSRVATQWPADAFVPDARKIVGDARFKLGRYAEAQAEWKLAQQGATAANRRAFADSVVRVRIAAAATVADSLVKRGSYVEAADSILAPIASEVPDAARAADVLRNAIEIHLDADSVARSRGDTAASRRAASRAITGIEGLAARYPTYTHTLTYNALRAKLLSDVGRPADAAASLQALADANRAWPGRADAMVRTAVILDSLGQAAAAAAAFERFSAAYPADKRAADAQYNAAVILRDAGDQAGAARAFQAFAARFARDPRLGDAQLARVAALRAAGDSAMAATELTRICGAPGSPGARPVGYAPANAACAERAGANAFREGMARWEAYTKVAFEIKTAAELTRDGVARASAPKLAQLRAMTAAFTRAVASGAPEWVAAGSFQSGLAQWYYGLFLRDVVLPAGLTDAQRTGAENGSAQQAQAYFDAAIAAWTALVDKAATDKFENPWVERARAALKGDGVPPRSK